MHFDLKYFRESILKMTQEEFAVLLGIRQDAVSRMERAPEQLSVEQVFQISQKTGYPIDDLLNIKSKIVEPLRIADNFSPLLKKKDLLDEFLANLQVPTIYSTYRIHAVSELYSIVKSLQEKIRKPRIAFLGNSDVGKSTMINTLLGTDKLPASWTPTTSMPIFIKHTADKPANLTDEAFILSNETDAEAGIDFDRLNDAAYFSSLILASGTYEILTQYGSRKGDQYKADLAGAAVLFTDSPLLQTCDIIDLPGFGTGDREGDDTMSQAGKNIADAIVYLSIANGFVRATDIAYIKEAITALPVLESKAENDLKPLRNLFVVASQAHNITLDNSRNVDAQKLQEILNDASNRFMQTLPAGYWDSRTEQTGHTYDEQALRQRFFSFSKDHADLRETFEQDLKQLLEQLPAVMEKSFNQAMISASKTLKQEIVTEISNVKADFADKEEKKKWLEQAKAEFPSKRNEILKQRDNILKEFNKQRDSSLLRLENGFQNVLSTEHIISTIEDLDLKNKKDDREILLSLLSSSVEQSFKEEVDSSNKTVAALVENFVGNIKENLFQEDLYKKVNDFSIHFDPKKAFLSGLAGLAAYGGLAFYMSTLGNLGGYILVTQGVGLLSSLGISVGGTAAAVSFVSSIGGPITLAIGLAVAASMLVFTISGIGWKKSLAKRIIKAYHKENVIEEYSKVLRQYWKDTNAAFGAGVDNMIKELSERIANEEALLKLKKEDHAEVEQALRYVHDKTEQLQHIFSEETTAV